jgi:uncharacterized surface protein with fasciclin (FAS1) repeats
VPQLVAQRGTGRRRIVGAAAGAGVMLLTRWTPALAQTPTPAPTGDIVDTAAAGQFTTLVRAVQAAGLVDTLEGPGPFTVFAPTDAAFAKLPAGTLDDLLRPENKARLAAILTYHVVPGRVTAAEVARLEEAETVNGETVDVKADGGGVMINDARVTAADVAASNGVIHVIDAVMLPPAG